jgi:OOP family OmpA-OmpF porin
MKNGKPVLAILGFVMLAAVNPAAAQEPGIYLGGSAGYSQYKDVCKDLIVPCDDHDTTWRAFGGYQFNNWFALELGYGDLGAATGAGIANTGTPGDFSVAVEQAWDLTAVFLFPVTDRLSALGRVGMYRARMIVEERVTGFPDTHEAGTNSGFSYGVGAEFRLGPLGLRTEWQRYENVGVAATGEDDIDVFSVGLLWRF